jgi:penicillin-binding protein 1A
MAFFRSRGIRIALALLALIVASAAAGVLAIYVLLIRDLPDFHSLDDYQPPVVSEVYDRNGHLIGEFYTQKRRLVPIDEIPRHVQVAFVSAEDGSFFEHQGIDLVAILRAALANIREGGIAQGASTITQQMVKSLLLTPERTYKRKMREIILSWQIENKFSKDEILFLYLNQIYFGNGAWGIGQASRSYFGKEAPELRISEAAMLAGLVQRPSAYDPTRNPEAAETRRRYVLGRMLSNEYIDQETYDAELASPPVISLNMDGDNMAVAGHFTEEVRRLLFDRLDSEVVLNEGLQIHTTLDIDLQRAALEALQNGLEAHDHRRGFRGPLRQVEKTAIEEELAKIGEENLDDFETQEIELAKAQDSNSVESENISKEGPGASDSTDAESAPNELDIAENESGNDSALQYSMAFDQPLTGIVLEVYTNKQSARIGFGLGVEGMAHLDDVDWARQPNLKVRPRPVTQIESIFKRGDVARFVRLKGEAPEIGDDEAINTESVEFARLDIWQEPAAEGALLSIDNETGDVIAMIGGYDFERSEFNRAVQAERQPGSAFKPFIYGAALTRGYTPVSTVVDRPVVYTDPVSGFVWAPQNYGRKFYGPMTMRDALKKSINNATVHLFRDLGVRYVIDYARRFGIQAPLASDLSLALGSSSLTLLELTRAYAVYPRGGTRVVPRFINEVTDAKGVVLLGDVPLGDIPPPILKPLARGDASDLESYPDSEIMPTTQIVSPADAYLMSDLLRAVVQEGTGRGLLRLGRTLAGKTGTTNDFTDAWFMGFSPEITTGVWVGHDDNHVLGWGESGGKTALPIWREYMGVALKPFPRRDFEVPDKIEFQRIDKVSGLIADANTQDAYFQPFLEGTAPERSMTEQATTQKTRQAVRDDFF